MKMASSAGVCIILIFLVSSVAQFNAFSTIPSKPVSLDLYYETFCPYCANFIINGLAPIFGNGLIDIVDLKFFPWGNAKLKPNNTFTCQHGPPECFLNTIHACAIHAWPTLDQHFPFIYCVEKLVHQGNYTQWQTCFATLDLDPKPVHDCYFTGYGNKLDLMYAEETNSLQPPHKYVPWVVVDGQPLYEDYENFTSYVCKAYKGPSPKVCSEQSLDNILKTKTDDVDHVSYTEEETLKMPFLASILPS